ncbi:MAG: short-chain dehydrogenase [Proteobacteria bacterium]|nr:MAG: short-chain dehydrogenase [Pseudomonadota bacterium]
MDERATLAGRTLLVTGASSGIGAAVTLRLLSLGARVVGLARRPERFVCPDKHVERFEALALDLRQLDALPGALEGAARGGGWQLDGAVLAAGAGRFGSLEELSYGQIRELIDLDLTAQIFCVRWLLPQLKRGRPRCGDVVLIGSEAGLSGGRRGAVYAAAKTGLQGLARALRLETAKSGLRVTVINPGMVETPFFEGQPFAPGEGDDEHLLAEDVAAAVELALTARPGAVFDEIDLSPQKTVLRFRRRRGDES